MIERQIAARDLVVYVSSTGMGRGDEELGAILMSKFLDTLAQFKDELSHVILVNGGARLVAEGSPVLEQLRQLEQVGVEVLACGTCLDHFGIKDRIAVGSVSNMVAIIETLSRAGRTIKP
jgi:selenium metabolism protein YedF